MPWIWIVILFSLNFLFMPRTGHAHPSCQDLCQTTCATPSSRTHGRSSSWQEKHPCFRPCVRTCRRNYRRCIRSCAYEYLLALRRCNQLNSSVRKQQCQQQAQKHSQQCENHCSPVSAVVFSPHSCIAQCKKRRTIRRRRCQRFSDSASQQRCRIITRTVYVRCIRQCRRP